MPDAEVIPLGTRGRPGRGTGNSKPSSAARSLAGGAAAKKAAPRKKAAAPDTPAPPPVAPQPDDAPQQAAADAPQQPPRDIPRADSVLDREPQGGIPVGDWLAAFTTAAKEVFGESWEPRLADFLAFLRRRVTGDYTVDEYGFDPEVTHRFFLTAIRPIAE
jgi:hypothetical protein